MNHHLISITWWAGLGFGSPGTAGSATGGAGGLGVPVEGSGPNIVVVMVDVVGSAGWEVVELAVVGLSACKVGVVAVVVAFRSFLSSLLIMVQWRDGRVAGWHTGTDVVSGEEAGVGWSCDV